MRAATLALFLLACRREETPVKRDPSPVVDAAIPIDPAAALLFYGRVIDLHSVSIARVLTTPPPAVELANGDLAWFFTAERRLHAIELATGRIAATTKIGCGQLTAWGERVVCRGEDHLYIVARSGEVGAIPTGNVPVLFMPLATRLLVRLGNGPIELYDEQAKLVSKTPVSDPFASITREGADGYCVTTPVVECFDATGKRKYVAKASFTAATGSALSFSTNTDGFFHWASRTDAKGTEYAVMRLSDGAIVSRAPFDTVVSRSDGTLAGLLRMKTDTQWVAADGTVHWTSPVSGKLVRTLVTPELLVLAVAPLTIHALRFDTGAVAWTRALTMKDGGVRELSLRVRENLLIARTDRDGWTESELDILDLPTGKLRLHATR
jgi:hypothetical protein